ncbi:MAG TPA: hypothetical protein VK842_08920 [bacterium]|jgi:hypothetical protein|nr:hypothetical protein [bacterium]
MAGKKTAKKKAGPGPWIQIQRAAIEAGFIIFLFYSNLLMGEYTRANAGPGKGLLLALADVFTAANFAIALVTSLIGYVVVEYLRTTL